MTDKTEPETTTEPDTGTVVPDPLAMSVASTAEDYTAAKLTPDPGSDIGRAIPAHATVEELPDTAEKPHPTETVVAAEPEADGGDRVEAKHDRGQRPSTQSY